MVLILYTLSDNVLYLYSFVKISQRVWELLSGHYLQKGIIP